MATPTRPARPPQLFAIPAGTPAAKCRSCGAEGYWTKTKNNKPILVICDGQHGSVMPTGALEGAGWAHFIDCPHSKHWSRK